MFDEAAQGISLVLAREFPAIILRRHELFAGRPRQFSAMTRARGIRGLLTIGGKENLTSLVNARISRRAIHTYFHHLQRGLIMSFRTFRAAQHRPAFAWTIVARCLAAGPGFHVRVIMVLVARCCLPLIAAREAGRRVTCSSNLKQSALRCKATAQITTVSAGLHRRC